MLQEYLENLQSVMNRGDAREESYYSCLEKLIYTHAEAQNIKRVEVTTLPKKTEAGNPDFRVWDGSHHVTGYIEAKDPSVTNLDPVEDTDQLRRYLSTFPNVILTNFYEFRLYRDGQRIAQAMIGRPVIARKLKTAPPVEKENEFVELLNKFFSFSLPHIRTAKALALELAKRTRFLRDEVIGIELAEEERKGQKAILGFFEAFKKYLIGTLTQQQFADLYAQTITYGLFAARTRAGDRFNRELAFTYIPDTIGILRDVFRFISLETPPKSLQIIVDDIAEVLHVTDVKKILQEYFGEGRGKDPILHFYETFLAAYDPKIRERRGVYYTPESVVGYIVRSIHQILKTHFGLADGLASPEVTLLDPAGGTLTFPAEAIRLAVEEYTKKYGEGGKTRLIKNQILRNFYAFELMMAPYAIGHLKMSFLFEELGYQLADDERFRLYLTNTLEMEDLAQIHIPGLSSLSEESHLAGEVKKKQPILVILGNPPYSGISANINEWTERLLKEDIDGAQSYYKVDGKSLGERNPKWLQDDYVKFLRFAQWKIQKAGFGVVGMITNHSYLDNPTFRGMRQSLMNTFNEIYILDLHGNSLKKETCPDGSKDENVFDIRQGVAIALFIKQKEKKDCKVWHVDKYGLREEKYEWLDGSEFNVKNYQKITPISSWYLFVPKDTEKISAYLEWMRINDIFPLNGVGMTTARDNFVIDDDMRTLENRIRLFKNSKLDDEELYQFFQINKKMGWSIRKAWRMLQSLADSDLKQYILPVLYRPFDLKYIFWHDAVVWRTVKKIMHHMLEENIGLTVGRQGQVVDREHPWNLVFITGNITDFNLYYRGGGVLFPLYFYPDKENKDFFSAHQTKKEPNIAPVVFEKLETAYGKKPTPEEILYYIYGVFYSNVYRERYAEFLKIDFPRVPFTADYKVFQNMGEFGHQLADLHLMKSNLLDKPVAKYQGRGENDRIEYVKYNPPEGSKPSGGCVAGGKGHPPAFPLQRGTENSPLEGRLRGVSLNGNSEGRVYINADKYFDGVAPELWNYHIGGYQVLHKFLKDRKGRIMDDSRYYCRIVTAIHHTIAIQKQIDKVYEKVERNLIAF